jgi:hypothetical protein
LSIHSTGLGKDERPRPKYCSIADWGAISGMRRSSTYEALGRGDLRAIKVGSRTLIDVEAGLAWLASMPAAEITTGRSQRRDRAARNGYPYARSDTGPVAAEQRPVPIALPRSPRMSG